MRRYDQNFKDEALKLSDDIGIKKACEQLNLSWRKLRIKKNKTGKTDADLQEENARLKNELEELKSATEILKEKIYQIYTTKLTVEEVKTIVWRYTFAYYNTKRVTTVNPGGFPPAVYRERTASVKNAA